MRFGLRLATSKKRGGVYPFCAQLSSPKPRHGGRGEECSCPLFRHVEGNLRVLCFKSDRPLLFHICSVAGTRWPKGFTYNKKACTLPPHQYDGGCSRSRPHPLPGGGGHGQILFDATQHQRGCLTRCPILQSCTFRALKSPLHGVPYPAMRLFRVVSCFGSPLHGVPNPTMRSFRVSDHRFMGCPIPKCGRSEWFRVQE